MWLTVVRNVNAPALTVGQWRCLFSCMSGHLARTKENQRETSSGFNEMNPSFLNSALLYSAAIIAVVLQFHFARIERLPSSAFSFIGPPPPRLQERHQWIMKKWNQSRLLFNIDYLSRRRSVPQQALIDCSNRGSAALPQLGKVFRLPSKWKFTKFSDTGDSCWSGFMPLNQCQHRWSFVWSDGFLKKCHLTVQNSENKGVDEHGAAVQVRSSARRPPECL